MEMDLSKVEWLAPPQAEPGAPEHLNCFQRTLLPFASVLGMEEEQAKRAGAYFGGGMGWGGTCGPVNAALLLLGAIYGGDPAHGDAGKEFLVRFGEANGSWLCEDIRDEPRVRCEKAIQFVRDYIEDALARSSS